jgi:DNA topoisomerase-3
MAKSLIIAEKPSVANDIARVLGGFTRHGEYFENDDYVVSSAVGHLLEIAAPEAYEVKRGKWSFANLPVIPPHFDLNPIAKSESRLKVLAKLIKRKDISSIINACDAGREGELIFRYIIQATKSSKPSQRLWLQSMTPAAIRDAFSHLRTDQEMQPLADAARSRSEADWLVGINGTRAMTAFNSKSGGFFLTTVGRVQTPTLMIVVEREQKIRKFVSRDYWEVRAVFKAAAGDYEAKWFNPSFKKDDIDPERRENRLWQASEAQLIAQSCLNQLGTVTDEAKPSSQLSPMLFDLTSLQREANSRFGFSAKVTLSIAQELYERHKALTYPRTDSKHLPEDYQETIRTTIEALSQEEHVGSFAKEILKNKWIKPNKRIFDNSKISDHFAIIPTPQPPQGLNEVQQKIYDLVLRRFLSVFYPAAEYLVTTRITKVQSHHFKTEGKILVKPGWLAIFGKDEQQESANLPLVQAGEKPPVSSVDPLALVTRPPARYSEATLLSAMEGAGKLIEDDELRDAMAQKGLGTPATRAAVIERLIAEKYLVREGRELIPTAKAFQLLTLLNGLGIPELTQPELTGEWEYKLLQMELGQLKRESFMTEISNITERIVKRAKEYEDETVPGDYVTLKTPCPHCGGVVSENYRRFACLSCEFSISKTPGGRQFELEEVELFLRDRTIGPLQGFRSKMGRPFAAILKIVVDNETKMEKLEFDFGQSAEDAQGEEVDFSQQTALGTCPKCQGRVFDHGMNYICENTPPKRCSFKSGKVVLRQEIKSEQIAKLLSTGRTDLLDAFISNRTNRRFKAYLTLLADGKIGFEFAAKVEKPGAVKKAVIVKKTTTKVATAVTSTKKIVVKKSAAKKPRTSKT